MSEKHLPYEFATTGLDAEVRSIYPFAESLAVHLDFPPPNEEDERLLLARIDEARKNSPQREGRLGVVTIEPTEDERTGHLIVYHFPWSGHVNGNEVGWAEAASLAAQNPCSTLVIVDSPATGASRHLKRSVSKEIARTGSYLPYADMAVGSLKNVLNDYDMVTFAGSSQGARRSVAMTVMMADLLGKSTLDLRLQDPVGSHEQTIRLLMKGMAREAGHSARYVKASPDEEAALAQQTGDSPLRLVRSIGKLAAHGGFWNQFAREPLALAHAGMAADLSQALPHVTDTLRVNTPERSELTNVEDMQELLEVAAAALQGGEGPDRIEHLVLLGQTHSMYAGFPRALGRLLFLDVPGLRQ